MRKKLSSIMLASISGVMMFSPTIVLAQYEVDPSRGSNPLVRQETRDETAPKRAQRETAEEFKRKQNALNNDRADRCQLILDNIENRISRYQNNFDFRTARYEQMSQHITAALTRLAELGVDVTSVTELMRQFDVLENNFETAFATMIGNLRLASNMACDDTTRDAFKTMLTQVQNDLAEVRITLKTVHDFIQDQLKPAIMSLRLELGETNQTQ